MVVLVTMSNDDFIELARVTVEEFYSPEDDISSLLNSIPEEEWDEAHPHLVNHEGLTDIEVVGHFLKLL